MQIIIAEDEPIARTRLLRTIQRLGHDARATADGAHAWAMFTEDGADVIITDWMMPGLDGPELCRRVRAHPTAGYTYIIFLTALQHQENVKEALEAGADDYLVKPLTLEEIEARLIVAARVTHLYRERAEALAHRETLLQVARNLAAESDPERVLSAALLETVPLLHVDGAILYVWEEPGQTLASARSSFWSGSRDLVTAPTLSAASHAASTRRLATIGDYAEEAPESAVFVDHGIRAAIAVPLLHEGRLFGVLEVGSRDSGRTFSTTQSDTLELLAASMCRALVAIKHTRTLQELADTDPLTGLANRRSALDVMKRYLRLADRQGRTLTLAILDIDHFKVVNDVYGHPAGDVALQRLARFLEAAFRSEDVVARWGGDEFVIGAYDMPPQAVLDRLSAVQDEVRRTALKSPDGKPFHVTFSAGVAHDAGHAKELLELYASADRALYTAKAAGRDHIVAVA